MDTPIPDPLAKLQTSLAHFGRHAEGWRTRPGALTKQEVFAKLAVEGVRRGLIPIGEFEIGYDDVLLGGSRQSKAVDIVWARRHAPKAYSPALLNGTIWEVVAAFEIEGYDNGKSKTVGDHLKKDAMALAEARQKLAVQTTAIVLYSVAYDRLAHGAPHPDYKDTGNAAKWTETVREKIRVIDGQLRAQVPIEVIADTDLDAWLATVKTV